MNTSTVWNSTTKEDEVHASRNSESESENEWTDILVTEQGGLDTKTRKIQDDLEEPEWDKKVDDIIWEDDEPVWNKKTKKNIKKSSPSSTDNLTQMKDWANIYNSSNPDTETNKSSKKNSFRNPKRKMDLFDLNMYPEWQIVSNPMNWINSSSYVTQAFLYSVLVSFLVLFIAYFSSSSSSSSSSFSSTTHEARRATISPITALTTPSNSMALIPHYNKNKKNRELALYTNEKKMMLIHRPLGFARNIRHLKHLGVISDCATEMYSVDSYLFIASCTFGILLFPQSMNY